MGYQLIPNPCHSEFVSAIVVWIITVCIDQGCESVVAQRRAGSVKCGGEMGHIRANES